MLFSENSYNTIALNANANNDHHDLYHDHDDLFNETPKVFNDDLLNQIDLNFISPSVSSDSDQSINSPDSILSNDDLEFDLLKPFIVDNNDINDIKIKKEEIDEDIFSNEINEIIHDVFNNVELEERSVSNPVISFNNEDLDTISNNKRSFSTTDLSSNSKKKATTSKKQKTDELGCTPYTRKQRFNPLPPIIIKNDGDAASIKRARNTEAARRSRARKMERMSQLENKCEDLINENNLLKLEIENLKNLLNK
ncbi:amino acid starvation-responsive transcription factor [Pichia kluyveri]|uniref:Amino acid starvation-responsive transcription factor n=1 Tax=Pichia kluyveri TaxID=36015 RepID=A0AAV5RAN7_PICKL|nr:amino acid starvation-responsive transcription factor [Pichia kluyveri]